jgi:hypothetical protein
MSEEIADGVKAAIRKARDVSNPVGLAGAPSYSMSPLQKREEERWVASQVFKGKAPFIMYCKKDSCFVTPTDVGGQGMAYYDFLGRDHVRHESDIIQCSWDEISKFGCAKYRELMRSFAGISQQLNLPVRIGEQYIAPESGLEPVPTRYCPMNRTTSCSRFTYIPQDPQDCISCIRSRDHDKATESTREDWRGSAEYRRQREMARRLTSKIKSR